MKYSKNIITNVNCSYSPILRLKVYYKVYYNEDITTYEITIPENEDKQQFCERILNSLYNKNKDIYLIEKIKEVYTI